MNQTTSRSSAHRLLIALVLVSFGLSRWSVGVSRASTNITVNSAADALSTDGKCTLREAIIAANKDLASSSNPGECAAGSGPDTIILPPGTYTLTRNDSGNEDSASTGDLDIKSSLIISPTGPVTITAVSNFTDRIFQILTGNVTISGVTIKKGNSGYGGAIHNAGILTVTNSTFTDNKASVWGGAIKNAGTLNLTNVTISGNSSKQDGGGLYNLSGTATLNNVTITNNTADSDGNGSGNGGGVFRSAGTVNIKNTIIAGNFDNSAGTNPTKRPDCSGTLTSLGYNLLGKNTGCTFTPTTGDQVGTGTSPIDPKLGPLQNNGGPTPTHALLSGSPAIDAGNPAVPGSGGNACAATDQRGMPRPQPVGGRCDIGAFELVGQPAPVLIRAIPSSGDTTVEGRLTSSPGATFTVEIFVAATCGGSQTSLGTFPVTTDSTGNVYFTHTFTTADLAGQFVTAKATNSLGIVSGPSACVRIGADNDAWVTALQLPLAPPGGASQSAAVDDYLDLQGQSRWYKFTIEPGSKVIVALTNLPANFDLTIYKDISATHQSLLAPSSQQDLTQLGAEFAPDAYSPDAYSPDTYSPDAYSPDAYSAEAFSPDAYSPDAYSPDTYSPDTYSPDAYSPDTYSPDAYSSAQQRSLLGVSAFEGTAGEGILLNTWENTGDFYVRVRGRNGAFSPTSPFHLQVTLLTGACSSVSPNAFPASNLAAGAAVGSFKTIILTDQSRMGYTNALTNKLNTFAARSEVAGVVVNVGTDARVAAANTQANAHPDCPFAKNLVAQSIKDIVEAYRTLNPLEYVVIVGNDDVIPFFRYPDNALLANEKNYAPPVRDNTASQASLKLGYVLSQDRYGASVEISYKTGAIPIPDLAVGRLVETEADAIAVLDAYLATAAGVVNTPTASLVTGYDFLEDAANAVGAEFQAGLGGGATNHTLIAPRDLSPQDPAAWTADDLSAELLNHRHDLMFLAGHFSGNSALAADYSTRLLASEVAASSVNLENAIVFSAGCHAGYNIVNAHGISGVTVEPDWAQAFASKGATLIAGTGYQYGDTDFIEYSERLYLEFSKKLRAGTGPVAVGKALVTAKQAYLANTPEMRGIHEKAVLEATLFGLPMLSVDLPAGRGAPSVDPSIVTSTNGFSADPGATLGLRSANVTINPALTQHTTTLDTVSGGSTVEATYLSGSNGVISNPMEPVLPVELRNVSVAGQVLRGVGFRGGNFTNTPGITPLSSAATTELRGVHVPFASDTFYPVQLWGANYFDALASVGGATRLVVIPAQLVSSAPGASTATLRQYSSMSFRLYYSNNTTTFTGGGAPSTPALAAPPAIVSISGVPNGGNVTFGVRVVGNPAAGIQEVWVTYTALSGPFAGKWQSLDLTQSATDSTLWQGTLALAGTPAQDVRYIAQAVNGVGVVALDTNVGEYYTPGAGTPPTTPTALAFDAGTPTSGVYGSQVTFSAVLTSGGSPLAGQSVVFGLGPQTRQAFTDGAGRATVTLQLLGLPGPYDARASFGGNATYIPSSATSPFTITKQGTALTLDPTSASVPRNAPTTGIVATLTDAAGRPLGQRTVFFIVTDGDNTYSLAIITDYAGRAPLGAVPLPAGTYSVKVYFSGSIPSPVNVTLTDDRYIHSTKTGSLDIVNIPPEATDDSYEVDEDADLIADGVDLPGVLANDSDGEDDPLTAALADGGGPAHGALDLNADGTFTYSPNDDFNGSDSFSYVVSDGQGGSDAGTVTITIHPVGDDPTANDDEAFVDEDSLDNLIDVLANDADADNLSGPANAGLSVTAVGDPLHGTAVLTEAGDVLYTPDADFFGDDTFSYTISDGTGSDTAAVTVHVANVNDDPTAGDDTATVVQDSTDNPIDVLANDGIAPDVGETLSVTGVSDPPHGTAAFTASGVTYTPDAGYHGPDAFTYTISDGNGGTATATVTITVTPPNHAPDCDAANTSQVSIWSPDKSLRPVSVVGVTDPDGDTITITITGIRQDERVGTGSHSPDGQILGPNSAKVRAERNGGGDGRVYHLLFTASDGRGGMCSGDARVGVVPHDQGGDLDAIDGGPLYDSTVPG